MIDHPGCAPQWVAEPKRLWSLYDMLRFHVPHFVGLMRDVQLAASVFSCEGHTNENQLVKRDARDYAIAALAAVETFLTPEMPISRVMRFNIQDLRQRLDQDETMTLSNAALRMKLLHDDIVKELATSAYFLMMTVDEAEFYQQPNGPVFGPDVAARFEGADFDISSAARCLALDEPTAAVFHLMRAVELALRLLTQRLRIKRAEWSDWGYLLKNIDGRLKEWENHPRKTTALRRKLQFYARARSDFAAFNEAWRKHVSHSRAQYELLEAKLIYQHVRALMQQLAGDLA